MGLNTKLYGADEEDFSKEKKKNQNVMLDPLEYQLGEKKAQKGSKAQG